ncbi:MAG: nitric oxide synthase oxygenase [Pseudonocardiales bacterium]|nr:MAG: nitric oxide synthase oxygenase [Pseudonocardiales bacterium]
MPPCPISTAPPDVADLDDRQRSSGGGAPLDRAEARAWLEMFFAETRPPGSLEQRWAVINEDVDRTGTYAHTFAELEWGARVAWRQSVRCIGRGRWRSLVVRDARTAVSIDDVAAELSEHLRFATNGGRIRSTITVFAQDGPAGPRARVVNEQLIRYAGFADQDGVVVGDPRFADFTALLAEFGWQPPATKSAFDVLPWLIDCAAELPRVVPVPPGVVLEVPISHPDLPWFADLGLRWHAVPVISNMRLRVGGIDYSCAPFNGFYLVDEIATRDFGDRDRYDQLPRIAARMGLDTESSANFWQLRAAVELNTAVLYSFRRAGVRIEEPIAESTLFAEFAEREEAAGRRVYGDWSWINGHIGSTFGPAWHRYYDTGEPNPNFWLDSPAGTVSALSEPSV